ncbi:MAG: potassium channel family protein [Candidatus Odinarchaeia archaeon]
MDKTEYEPISIREALIEMKDIAELLIDLAYSAVLYKDKDIAEEVLELESRMDTLSYIIQMNAMLAARSAEDSEQLGGLLKVAAATDKISDAAADIAATVLKDIEPHSALLEAIRTSEVPIIKVRVSENSPMKDKDLDSLNLREIGVDIIAIKRGKKWIYDPMESTVIHSGDILFARGTKESLDDLKKQT